MILELLESMSYPDFYREESHLFVCESIAIKSRYKRHHGLWSSHLEESKKMIRNFLTEIQETDIKSLTILGSGNLFDLPIEEIDLISKKIQIELVDLFFPYSVRLWARKNKRIRLTKCDLSQFLTNHNLKSAVISCNTLSQISLFKDIDNLEKITKSHLKFLKSFEKVLLITDYEKILKDENKKVIETQKSVHLESISEQLGHPLNIWNWEVAPIKEIDPNFSVTLKVGCFKS